MHVANVDERPIKAEYNAFIDLTTVKRDRNGNA